MFKLNKLVIIFSICAAAVVLFCTCNIFPGDGLYAERNLSGYKTVALESPRVVLQRLRDNPANAGKSVEVLFNERPELSGSLNRLAFGVSSRRFTAGALPVPVYTDYGVEPGFRPWGNYVWDSDEYNAGLYGNPANRYLEDNIFAIDPKKGQTDRQIILCAINETNNAGKIAGSEDGITYYFKRVPRDVNFRISADFYVDSYGFTGGRAELNGQEAFGFMARDWIPQHHNVGNSGTIYPGSTTNRTPPRPGFDGKPDHYGRDNPDGIPRSGGAPYDLTEVGLKDIAWDDVYWNGQDTSLNDGVASSSNMIMVGAVKRGMRVYWRTGVRDPDGEKMPIYDFNSIANADFARFDYKPRELSDYSIYGSGIDGTQKRPDFPTAGLTYKLYLEKTNSGFIARIEPPKGVGKGVTKDRVPNDGFIIEYNDRELPFPDLLCGPSSVERDHYYIGLFAARDAKVTVSNLRYEESPSDMCPKRIEPEPERITPAFSVQSPVSTSADKYTLYARSNVEGTLMISFNGGTAQAYMNEWIVETTNASARPFSLFKIENIPLKQGDNIFDMVFIPDRKQYKSGFMGVALVDGKEMRFEDMVPKKDIEYLMTDTKSIVRSFIVNRRSLNTGDYFPLHNNAQDKYSNSAYGKRIEREVIWVAPNGKVTGSGSYDNPLDIKTAIAVSSVVGKTPNDPKGSGQVIMLKDGVYTPMDPPEVIDGGMRVPIRLVVPRYNSGRANPAVESPQPRPGPDNPSAPYPDPYADEYYRFFKVMKAENRDKAIIDFRKDLRTTGYAPRNFEMNGDYWIIDGIHVRNAEDTYGGLRTAGSNNLFRWIKTYFNGDSGLWISGYSNEPKSMWPANVRVEYCESFGNIDQARTNADGFAAKLTTWENIVFYRCIGHHNTDDGWDLFAKKETGPIGAVRIDQSFAYSNGRYLNDEVGRNYSEINALAKMNYSAGVGGNGFKMGGEGIPVTHLVINSITWGNDGDGVTSNSDPAILITHVSAFDNYNRVDTNPGSNFAIYSSSSPSYEGLDAIVTQVLSWRSDNLGSRNDRLEPKAPSSGYVWRNYFWEVNVTDLGDTSRWHSIYDANNGKDSAVLTEFPSAAKPAGVKNRQLEGKSVGTQYIARKYGSQQNLVFGSTFPGFETTLINKNNTSVNEYIDSREFKLDDFRVDPRSQFYYGTIDPGSRNYTGYKRSIYTDSKASPFGIPGDVPYRRLDGSSPRVEQKTIKIPGAAGSPDSTVTVSVGLANRADGKIDGDFLEIYDENSGIGDYFIGLPNLHDFMRLNESNFPGVAPGARMLWP